MSDSFEGNIQYQYTIVAAIIPKWNRRRNSALALCEQLVGAAKRIELQATKIAREKKKNNVKKK